MFIRPIAITLTAAVSLTAPAAHSETNLSAVDALIFAIGPVSHAKPSVDDLWRDLTAQFRKLERDGLPGLSEGDQAAENAVMASRRRAAAIAEILQSDLNGDLKVTEEELKVSHWVSVNKPYRTGSTKVQPSIGQIENILAERLAPYLALDTDEDGAISIDEIVANLPMEGTFKSTDKPPFYHSQFPAAIDLDADGAITEEELETLFDQAVHTLDLNNDGALDDKERNNIEMIQSSVRLHLSEDNH